MTRTWYRVRFDDERGCEVKRCSLCHVEKPVTEFSPRPGGYRPRCKECRATVQKAAYDDDPEKYRAISRNWAQAHPDETHARFKDWYTENHEYNLTRSKRYYGEHPEERRAYSRKRRKEIYTPEMWAQEYRERASRGYYRAWAAANPDKRLAAGRRWRLRHPELHCLRVRLRLYAIRVTAGAHLMTKADIIARDGAVCYLCGQPFPPEKLTIEHVMPLSRGGGHTPDNLRVACRPCNCRKGAKLPEL